jgi:hypothetical protein
MANMELITSVTVGSGGAASVTLPATGTIPATHTDLQVLMSVRTAGGGAGDTIRVQFNSSAANFTVKELNGDGATTGSSSRSDGYIGFMNAGGSTSSTFSNASLYIPNYTSSNYKSYSVDKVSEQNGTTAYAELVAGLWSNTAAITSLTFVSAGSFNIVEGSTFYLYGISNVTSGSKATGGVVSSDGTYWYHTFPFSGTFTPTQSLTADVLAIAGGGGGGSQNGGGGGAGGLVYLASQSLTATGYSVSVGAGGAQATTSSPYGGGSNGGNSQFASLTAAVGGGGGGGRNGAIAGASGGSGGGASQGGSAGAGTAGQGNDGGLTISSQAGGGGGAGEVGNTDGTGVGGDGVSTYSSWANATQTGANNGFYAGGGAGGNTTGNGGGDGGGGGTGRTGVVNTGGGGGAWDGTATPFNGGSGLVIIRYTA